MTITIRELKQMVEDNCDPSQPLRVVSRDVGKKASKHSVIRVNEDYPVRFSASKGKFDERAYIEFAHYYDSETLMPETFIEVLEKVLEEEPKATVGWVYFFFFPMDHVTLLKKVKRIDCASLDSSKVKKIYLADDEPNTLVIEAEYEISAFA